MSDLSSINFDCAKQIHSDIYLRLNKKITQHNDLVDQVEHCANDNITLAKRAFITSSDSLLTTNAFISERAQRLLPAELKDIGGDNEDIGRFKSLLGMLQLKAESFTPEEKQIYDRACANLRSVGRGTVVSDKENKDDKKLWRVLMPLVKKYGKEIIEDLIAHMLDQSIDAWCNVHNDAPRHLVSNHLDKVFSPQVRVCFNMLDWLIAELTRKSTQQQHGAVLRHGIHNVMNAIAAIPLALHHHDGEQAQKKETAAPKADDREPGNQQQSSPGSASSSGVPGGITVHGSHASVSASPCCHGVTRDAKTPEPWSAVAEQLLTPNKLSEQQCYDLLKALIDGMSHRLGAVSHALSRDTSGPSLAEIISPAAGVLPLLNAVTPMDSPADAVQTLLAKHTPNGQQAYVNGHHSPVPSLRDSGRPETPEPDYAESDDNEVNLPVGSVRRRDGEDAEFVLSSTPPSSPQPNEAVSPDSGQRHVSEADRSSASSLSSFASDMYQELSQRLQYQGQGLRASRADVRVDPGLSPKSPLSNFSLASLESRPVDEVLHVATRHHHANEEEQEHSAPLLRRRQQQDLSLSLSDASHTGIPQEDADILKHWLKLTAEKYNMEQRTIDRLQHDGLRVNTLEHFLESAFIASPGTEVRSDVRQRYIREAFMRLRAHDDFNALSRKTCELVEKYAVKHSKTVFATTPTRSSYLQGNAF